MVGVGRTDADDLVLFFSLLVLRERAGLWVFWVVVQVVQLSVGIIIVLAMVGAMVGATVVVHVRRWLDRDRCSRHRTIHPFLTPVKQQIKTYW